ncbi:hypothetical protein [Maritimibacter dapengensis]|uniref:TonB C-terminal domain-containing protein n=1 Tax=Maritimibacter dapengensis TaxID=2836868 RepID=A0ABS6SZ37_9RHOB|nr:hypothetical protein [Maritimibacter dapengensis]MBV7378222.1 hypothetical protein [Maritimibacter dapengensis]
MGHVKLGSAVILAAGITLVAMQPAKALGAWECTGVEDAVARAEADREAMLSQRFVVTPEGRVDIVRIEVEQPAHPGSIFERVGREVLNRLGFGAKPMDREAALRRTALHDWTLSPMRPKRFSHRFTDC